ncbi:MAG TPA: hypothetical protein PKM11_05350 [Methanomassiliicoccales archaeon]|nr:hypothetical protein [Methanomassiliicoccales archaeon]
MTEEMPNIYLGTRQPSESEVELAVKRKIGMGAYLCDQSGEYYHFGVSTEKHLYDALSGNFKVKFVPFSPIFTVVIRKQDDGYHIEAPSRIFIESRLHNKMDGFRIGSEGSLLKAIGDKIISIPQIRNQINPLFEIVSNVINYGEVAPNQFVGRGRSIDKARNYFNFLKDVDILVLEDGKYACGPVICREMDSKINVGDMYNSILAVSIQKGHHYMSEFLNFTHISPFIRLGNSNYMPSFYAGELLAMSPEDLSNHHASIYGKSAIPTSKLVAWATLMANAGVFKSVKKETGKPLFTGDDDIFYDYRCEWKPKARSFGVG